MCILCVRVKINKRLFGSCFRTLVVILFQIIFQFIAELTRRPNRGEGRERASERASERARERERENVEQQSKHVQKKNKKKNFYSKFSTMRALSRPARSAGVLRSTTSRPHGRKFGITVCVEPGHAWTVVLRSLHRHL